MVSTKNVVPTLKFLRRINRSTFIWPVEKDVTKVEKEDILTILLAQKSVGEITFPISFESLNLIKCSRNNGPSLTL